MYWIRRACQKRHPDFPKPDQPMFPLLRRKGIGTLEVVIIIAVLLSVALIFRQALTAYATQLIGRVFNNQSVIGDIAVE